MKGQGAAFPCQVMSPLLPGLLRVPFTRSHLLMDILIRHCDRQNKAPIQDVHVLIPRTCGYITLQSKGEFEDVIKLGILKWEDYVGGPDIITKVLMSPYEW